MSFAINGKKLLKLLKFEIIEIIEIEIFSGIDALQLAGL